MTTLRTGIQLILSEHEDCSPGDVNCDFYSEVRDYVTYSTNDDSAHNTLANIRASVQIHSICDVSRSGHEQWCSLHDELADDLGLPHAQAWDNEPDEADEEENIPEPYVAAPFSPIDFHPRDMDALCSTCNRRAGEHRGGTGQCPTSNWNGYLDTHFTDTPTARTFRSGWNA
jgi:hypothetical protein